MSRSSLQEALAVESTYTGDYRITKILLSLGVDNIIAQNPHVIEKVEMMLREIASEEGSEKSLPNEFTEQQIVDIASKLKGKLSHNEMGQCFKNMREKTRAYIENKTKEAKESSNTMRISQEGVFIGKRYGIFVDQLTKGFTIQELISFQRPDEENGILATEKVMTTAFSRGTRESVIVISKAETKRGGVVENASEEICVNKDGIVESRAIRNNNGSVVRVKRTEDPILAEVTYPVKQGVARYYPMDLSALPNLMGNQMTFTGAIDFEGDIRRKRKGGVPIILGFDTIERAQRSGVYKGTSAALNELKPPEKGRGPAKRPEQLFRPRYAYGMTALLTEAGFKTEEVEGR